MTTNINSEVIMPSESKNWFVALLNRVFHRTKNNPKINPHHTVEQKKIILEGALNSLIPRVLESTHADQGSTSSESMINVVAQKNKVTEQWQHNRANKETTSNFESTEQGTQPSSLGESIHADQAQQNTASMINVIDEQQKLTTDLGEAVQTIQEAGINKSSEENDEMAVAKSTVEMTSDEVIDYAKERVAESPLKKTLAGIKFPKRKVAKVEQVEKDKEV